MRVDSAGNARDCAIPGHGPACSPAGTTTVDLFWVEDQNERWIRFGHPVCDAILDRRRRRLAFAPGSVFAYVRWASNDYGTALSRLAIVRAVWPGERCSTLVGVHPGGDLLLDLSSWARVARAFAAIDAIEDLGIDPAFAAPDYWRHVHNRLSVGYPPRAYSRARHRAWLLRQEVGA
ncbi:DUF2840 domain-containing protein [Sphingomonas sp. R647]|uniref:DUF2840 domain-containing protein n=1 Tax=Sphingomonas sp. R647 TaxID=2875233 RepID=UPI001CD3C0DB|nr:DUF2840 domain-containing protein [Sphingomonas sp. R647]MCA1200162.1 DUF2840 domain-containing protein [Sphingomonas sp. R647]